MWNTRPKGQLELALVYFLLVDPRQKKKKNYLNRLLISLSIFKRPNCILHLDPGHEHHQEVLSKNETVRLYNPKLAAASNGLVKSKGFLIGPL